MNENKTYRTLDGDTLDISWIKDADEIIREISRLYSEFGEDISRLTSQELEHMWDTFYLPEISRLEGYLYPYRNINDLKVEEGCGSPLWENVYNVVGFRFAPAKLPYNNYWLEYMAVNLRTGEVVLGNYPADRLGNMDTTFVSRCHKLGIVKREVKRVLRKAAL